MTPSKMCGLAVIIVVIAPLLVGLVWPTDESTETEYIASNEISLNGSIGNRDIPIMDSYTGPQNALYILDNHFLTAPAFAEYGASQSTYQKLGSPETIAAGTVDWLAMNDYAVVIFGVLDIDNVRSLSGIYYPANKMLLHQNMISGTFEKILVDAETEVIAQQGYQAYPAADPAEYGLASEGLAGRSGGFQWINGFRNDEVEIWFSTETDDTFAISQTGADNITRGVSITIEDGTITAYDGPSLYENSAEIGSTAVYDYVSVRVDAANDQIKIYGILNAAKINSSTFSYGNGIDWDMDFDKVTILDMEMPGRWWVTRTISDIGTAKGILDAEITPNDYYPGSMWQLRLVNPAQYGDQIRFGSVACAVNNAGQFTFDDTDGNEHTEQIRGLIVSSIVADSTQTVSINGYPIYSGEVDADYTIYLDGPWWLSVGLAKITTEDYRVFSWGGFGLDLSQYCVIGGLCCGAVFVGGLLWGRRNGGNVFPLLITMGCCAAVFYCLM